jgi:SWI/SNF related-matrix-associated actin-dependent regulator of chromatin subfamily C
MEEDSLNFGSDAAGGTPDANSILAQPPLQGESPSGQDGQGEGQAAESMHYTVLDYGLLSVY